MSFIRVHFALLTFGVAAASLPLQTVHAQGCAGCQTSQPAAIYYQPTVQAAQPVQVQPLYQTRTYRPIPRTSYRTEWIPNRITYYTPTVGVNAVTGAPQVSYRACQTRGQILQRVPTFGFYSSPAASVVPSAGCSSCTPAATIAPPATVTVPGTSAPSLAPSPAPATTVPGPARTTSPESNVPAETRPSLKPEAKTNAQGASIRGPRRGPSYGSNFNPSGSTDTRPQNSPSRKRVQPVPDPDAARFDEQPEGDAPLLLDPRHKTAARPSNFDRTYTQVAWPAANPARNQAKATASPSAVPATSPASSDWKTVDW